jgi:hypothetical protein
MMVMKMKRMAAPPFADLPLEDIAHRETAMVNHRNNAGIFITIGLI